MQKHTICFEGVSPIEVPTGTLITEAAHQAGVEIRQPCGGQGRCGRCAVRISKGDVRRRSTLRLTNEDLDRGFALGCQSVIERAATIVVPPQEIVSRRLTTDRVLTDMPVPAGYEFEKNQSIKRVQLEISEPTLLDQTDDWSRVQTALRKAGFPQVRISLEMLRAFGELLRANNWNVTAILNEPSNQTHCRLIDLTPTNDQQPVLGAAIDIGTTTVTVWLVDLETGKVRAQVAEYNAQINRGEDVISRIIYASKNDGAQEMQTYVLNTINQLLEKACLRVNASPSMIYKVSISGNSTMMHFMLKLPAETIRLSPFVTAINHVPLLRAADLGLNVHPEAVIDCLPGVASYVGADITAGVLSSGLDSSDEIALFIDIGTNGEIVLGSKDWLVSCACSAGPAFEGAGVVDGMRATKGAIEEVWINTQTFEPTLRVIGEVRPEGICGSGLISLLAELFLTGLLDKGGNFNTDANTKRIRKGNHGLEYVVTWADETRQKQDIVLTRTDVDNLLRAKAAIYAGFNVLADSVGISLDMAGKVMIGGAFGKYINVEKAVEIGLLPDIRWEYFQFLGNTSVQGAYLALLDRESRARISEIANMMTYIELSADNAFYDAFTSALFLPHTDISRFPSVHQVVHGIAGAETQVMAAER